MSRQPLQFTEGFLRGLAAGLAVLTVTLASSARAEQWTRVATVEAVAISVSQVSELELARLRSKHERADRSAIGRTVPQHRYGFALLFQDKETGAFRCEVYVRDPADTATLEHELRHCEGWSHE